MSFTVNVKTDVNAMLRRNADQHEKILRAAARAVNATAAEVRKAAINEIGERNRQISKQTIRGYVTVKQAKFSVRSIRQDGTVRKNYGGIKARVIAAGKAPNLIYFVSASQRNPTAFRDAAGVTANVMGKQITYDGGFVVRASNGKMIAVSKSFAAKTNPRSMREKDASGKWKWRPKWSKGLYGPPLSALAGNRMTMDIMSKTARTAWPGYWRREVEKALAGAA